MYNLCKITHPALGVEHSLYCNFFNHREKSLVVAGANIIRVFRLVAEVSPRSKKDDRNIIGLWMCFIFWWLNYKDFKRFFLLVTLVNSMSSIWFIDSTWSISISSRIDNYRLQLYVINIYYFIYNLIVTSTLFVYFLYLIIFPLYSIVLLLSKNMVHIILIKDLPHEHSR